MKHIKYIVVAASAAVAVLLTIAASSQGQGQYKLGGGFIGNNGAGNIWSALQIPLDPAGRTAALRVNLSTHADALAGLLSAFGADTLSEFVGQEEMTSRDTAKFGTVGYANQQGNPPQRRAIWALNGTIKFNTPDTFRVDYIIDVYPATADADADGFPDPGTVPAVSVPGVDYGKRVPIP